ncbi:MAG TPA: hypothetical protein VMF69_22235 [Gemmataceae bacterium]|nr:hypothetical protein [Gemmataceae bacterium]
MQNVPQLSPRYFVHRCLLCWHRRLLFAPLPFAGADPRFVSQAIGDGVEPTAYRIAFADRAGFARQHQKCRLENVLGVVMIAEDGAAQSQHHRRMALDQGGEGGFVAASHETLQ